MKQVLEGVSDRLGFDSNDTLTLEDLSAIYDVCRYERAWHPEDVSPWCAAFSDTDLKVLEFYEDLEYYHKNGYANDLNYKMSCPLIRDLTDTFNENVTDRPLGTFYFSHSEALLPFLALFGLYRDESGSLTHDSFETEAARNRAYRTSLIGSFSTSMAFVLFDCGEEVEGESQKLMAFHQEKAVKLAKCRDLACGWQEFQEGYADDIVCPFKQLCESPSTPQSGAVGTNPESGEPENGSDRISAAASMLFLVLAIMLNY